LCGLFGWKIREDALEDIHHYTLAAYLAHMSDRRGDESWGVMLGSDARTILKNVGSIKECKIERILDKQVMGHTRRATVGAVTVPNAHPFHIGKIIGAHNGFIYDHEALNVKYKRNYEVDSQHIFAHINDGIDIKSLSGCGSITYVHTDQPENIFLGRGTTGDLAVYGLGTYQKPTGIIWASTEMWLKEALELAGSRTHFSYDIKWGHLYRIESYKVMEAGEFDLKVSNGVRTVPVRYCGNHSLYEDGYNSIDWYRRHNGLGSKADDSSLDNYWAEWRARVGNVSSLESKDLEYLPAPLKKNQEIAIMGQGQSEKALETSSQCDGCRRWGATVDDYEDNANGIAYFPQIDECLCFQCYSWWGSETGHTNLAIPTLRLEMDERFLR
jgi:glutamine amidotransferase-like protein